MDYRTDKKSGQGSPSFSRLHQISLAPRSIEFPRSRAVSANVNPSGGISRRIDDHCVAQTEFHRADCCAIDFGQISWVTGGRATICARGIGIG